MRTMMARRKMVAVAVVLLLAAVAAPVAGASRIFNLQREYFHVDFDITDECRITTEEWATQHIVLGRTIMSTNVGVARARKRVEHAEGPCLTVPEVGVTINYGDEVPFTVIDTFNPLRDMVIKTQGIVASPLFNNQVTSESNAGSLLGLELPSPIQAGVNVWLVNRRSRTYAGYVYAYAYTKADPPADPEYLVVPFTATATADGYEVTAPDLSVNFTGLAR